MSGAKLRCENLRKAYGGIRALADLSMDFPATGVVAIVGPNGAGKSTLINAITGLAELDAGRVYFGEVDITDLSLHKIAGLGIVRTFQNLRLVFELSALENVLLAYRGQAGERFFTALIRHLWRRQEHDLSKSALETLDVVGLGSNSVKSPARNLSYGQQKLVSLACCLALGGDVLLLDEPLSGVHPQLGQTMQGLIRDIGASGKLVVFVEHDLEAVRAVADEVVVMDDGAILAKGNPADVLNQPDVAEAYLQ